MYQRGSEEEGMLGLALIGALAASGAFLLWVIAAIIAIIGIVMLFRGAILGGIVLLVVACLVGPGGYSIFQ